MSLKFLQAMRAVPILVVGMALLLSACQAPKIVDRIPGPEETPRGLFLRAESAFQEGLYEESQQDYELYLQRNPEGEDAGTVLYRIAWLRFGDSRYEEASELFQRMIRDYPDHPRRAFAQYYIVMIHYRLGQYEPSKAAALEWLVSFSDHPLRGEIFELLGKNARAVGDDPRALYWWIKADEELADEGAEKNEISEKIIGLIQTAAPNALREMAAYAAESLYGPFVYYRLARGYLDDHDLESARETAMALVRSTPEQHWVSLGRQILERIGRELSLRPEVIGCLLPLSGPFSIYGQEVLNGIQLGMGLFDKSVDQSIELIIKDTGGLAEKAVLQVNDLAQKGRVMAIIGPLTSKTSRAAAQRAQQLGVPIITLTQVDDITSMGDMVFRNFLTPSKEVKRLVEKAVTDMGMTRFGILYPDTPYGRFMADLFWDRLEVVGGTVKAVESYGTKETDFASQIKRMVGLYYPRPESVKQMLREMRAMKGEEEVDEDETVEEKEEDEEEPEPIVDFDAVFIPDNYHQVALIAPQFPFNGVFNVRFLGTSLWQSPELLAQAGEYVQGAVFSSGFYPQEKSDQSREFRALYRDAYDTEPGILAATGYDTIHFLKNVITQKGIQSRKDFRKGLLSHEGYYGITGEIAFDDHGEVIKDPTLLTVSGRHLNILP